MKTIYLSVQTIDGSIYEGDKPDLSEYTPEQIDTLIKRAEDLCQSIKSLAYLSLEKERNDKTMQIIINPTYIKTIFIVKEGF